MFLTECWALDLDLDRWHKDTMKKKSRDATRIFDFDRCMALARENREFLFGMVQIMFPFRDKSRSQSF